jgi:hypothetical protein
VNGQHLVLPVHTRPPPDTDRVWEYLQQWVTNLDLCRLLLRRASLPQLPASWRRWPAAAAVEDPEGNRLTLEIG